MNLLNRVTEQVPPITVNVISVVVRRVPDPRLPVQRPSHSHGRPPVLWVRAAVAVNIDLRPPRDYQRCGVVA